MAVSKNKGGNDPFVKCLKCKNAAAFYQWQKNPIIAQCAITNERQVAQTRRICKLYAPSYNESPDVKHFNSYEETP